MTATKARDRIAALGLVMSIDLQHRAGATYRQVDYWSRTGILEPESEGTPGSGVSRAFAPVEVDVARLLVRLSRAGLAPSSKLAKAAAAAVRAGKTGTVRHGPLAVKIGVT